MNLLNNFFSLFSYDIGIDLGTANTLVWVKGKGIVIREPSVIARHRKTKQIIAIGSEAKTMLGKTPLTIETVRPLRAGVIADFDAAEAMISHYIHEVHSLRSGITSPLIRPKVVIGIPSRITEVQRRAVWEAALSAGAREAYLIEEPMAAAIGGGLSVFAPTGMMVVDIGGGTTEIALISLGGIVVNSSLTIAGDSLDVAIMHYIRLRHGLIIGERTAENLKITIGSAYDSRVKRKALSAKHKEEKSPLPPLLKGTKGDSSLVDVESSNVSDKLAVIRGRDIESGLPKSLRVTEAEIREAISPGLMEIIDSIGELIQDSPPELTSDILEHGILLTGGGALLPGLDSLIVERTKIPVIIADDPLTTVVRGCGRVLEDETMLERVKVTGGLQ